MFAGGYAASSSGASLTSSYFVVTDRPQELARRILELSRISRENVDITVRNVAAVAQDLAVIRDGALIDPGSTTLISDGIMRLAAELRRSPAPATHMLSIEPKTVDPGSIVFECDGHIIESINPANSYERIVIAGTHGDTVFKLSDRALSVVSSSCRHELCKATGSIRSGKIICAPNRLIATIGKQGSIVDGISG